MAILTIYISQVPRCCQQQRHNNINQVISRIGFTLKSLYSINSLLPKEIRKKLAHALLMPILSYGIEIFSGTTDLNLSHLRVSYNNILRFIYKIPRNQHISNFSIDFIDISFDQFIEYRILILLYKTLFFQEPLYLYEMFNFSHSTRIRNLNLPQFTHRIMDLSYSVRAINLWNAKIPNQIKF